MSRAEKCSPSTKDELMDCLYEDCPFKDDCYEFHTRKGGLLDINPGNTATRPEGKRGKYRGREGGRPGFGGGRRG